jgi:hypothetical protein
VAQTSFFLIIGKSTSGNCLATKSCREGPETRRARCITTTCLPSLLRIPVYMETCFPVSSQPYLAGRVCMYCMMTRVSFLPQTRTSVDARLFLRKRLEIHHDHQSSSSLGHPRPPAMLAPCLGFIVQILCQFPQDHMALNDQCELFSSTRRAAVGNGLPFSMSP